MKKLVLGLIFSCIFMTAAQCGQHHTDIMVYSKLEKKWNLFLLQELRTFMKNLAFDTDLLEYTYTDGPIIYDEASIKDLVSEEAHSLVQKIEKVSGIDILDVRPELSIEDVGYKIQQVIPVGKALENSLGEVTFKADITFKGIEVFAKELSLTFLLNSKDFNKKIPALNLKVNRPSLKVASDLPLNFQLDITIKEGKDDLHLEFSNENFKNILNVMKSHPESFQIHYQDITVPEVSLQVMGRDLSINAKKLEEAIEQNKSSLQSIMLKQLIALIEKDGLVKSLRNLSHKKIAKEYWFNTSNPDSFASALKIKDLSVVGDGVLLMEAKGDFCTYDNFSRNGKRCSEYKQIPVTKSTISRADARYSKTFAEDKIKDESIHFIASLSEDYVNKIIATTIESNYWDDLTKAIGIELGDKGAFVKFDRRSDLATVYLDVIYDSGLLTGLLLNERYVRFPVILKVKSRIEDRLAKIEDPVTGEIQEGNLPHLVFNIFDVDLDENKMRYGVEDYGLVSNITEVRSFMQNTVIKKIKNELFDYNAPYDKFRYSKWKGHDLPGLVFPELSNMQLEKLITDSDGHGRLLLMLRAQDVDVSDY